MDRKLRIIDLNDAVLRHFKYQGSKQRIAKINSTFSMFFLTHNVDLAVQSNCSSASGINFIDTAHSNYAIIN